MYLVCDGGGTKTEFLLFDKTGRVWARARSGGANANFTPPQQAAAHVCTGIEECLRVSGVPLSEVSGIVLFIPGFHTVLPQVKEHFGRDDIRQMGDVENAFYAALGAPYGIAVLSGTGSFAVGQTKPGQMVRVGGGGPLFGGEGSGYHRGVLCLSKLANLYDADKRGTVLETMALQELGLADIADLRQAAYQPGFTRARVARLCYVVERAARAGDENACAILDEAADALSQLAQTVARRMGESCLPVALTGGVSNMGPLFTQRFEQAVHRRLPGCVCRCPQFSPVEGAALYVLCTQAGVDITDKAVLDNLKKKEKG